MVFFGIFVRILAVSVFTYPIRLFIKLGKKYLTYSFECGIIAKSGSQVFAAFIITNHHRKTNGEHHA